MAKFPSIWGDLEVGHVAPKADKPEDKKTDVVPDPAKPEPEKDPTPDAEPGTDPDPAPTATTATAEPAEPEAEVEYDEEMIEQAYNLLIDEGVLPEPGEDAEFDMSPAGLADATAAAVRGMLQKEIDSIPEPVQQFYAHVMAGNAPEDFKVKTPIVWGELDIDEEENQEAALMQFYINQGMSHEDALEEVEDVKTAGKLAKKAVVAQESLTKLQTANQTARAKAKAKADKEAADKVQKEIDDLNKTIDDTEEIAGFKLDDKRRKEFKDYLFKANPRTGKTQMQENMANEERRLNIAFLDFVDYTKADLEKEVTNDMTKKRRKKLTRFSDKGVKGSNSSKVVKTKTNTKAGKVKFPTIFGGGSIEVED